MRLHARLDACGKPYAKPTRGRLHATRNTLGYGIASNLKPLIPRAFQRARWRLDAGVRLTSRSYMRKEVP